MTLTLVNRERELRTLDALVRRTRSGGPGIAFLEGPVGIGKSALLEQLVAEAGRGGTRVLRAQGDALERDFPFGVVRQLFEPPLRSLDEPGRAALLDGTARLAAHALGGPAAPPGVAGPQEDVSFGVLHGLYWLTCNLAEREPLVIAVDDAHWADMASLRFLAHLARRIEGLPVLLALCTRTREPVTGSAVLDELAAQPLCRVLRPRPLAVDGINALVGCRFGERPDEAFSPACLAATGGNPLLVQVLLTALQVRGGPLTGDQLEHVIAADGALFDEVVGSFVRRQSETAAAVARAMAILGEGAPPQVCARLAGLSQAALPSAVSALAAQGLVSAAEGGWPWSFNHGLIRDAVVADMSPQERAEAHRDAARLLLDTGARAEQVAAHLLRTELPREPGWEVAVLREAAKEASTRGAAVLAVDLLRHALPEEPRLPADLPVLVDLGLAEAAVDVHASVRHLGAALPEVHDPVQRFQVVISLSNALIRSGQQAQAVRLLAEQGPTVRGDGEGEDLVRLIEAQRLLYAKEGVGAGEQLAGATPGERALLAARAVQEVVREERAEAAVAEAEQVLESGVSGIDQPFFLVTAATTLLFADRPDRAALWVQRIVETARYSHDLLTFGLGSAVAAEAAYRLGDLSDAVAATKSAFDAMPLEQWGSSLALPTATRVHALLEIGDLAGADAALAESAPATAEASELLVARGRLRLAHGRAEDALGDLLACGRQERGLSRTSPAVSSWWYWAGRAHLALGATGSARALAEEAVERSRRGGLPRALSAALRLLAQTESSPERRLPQLDEALAATEKGPAQLDLARVLVDHGWALHGCGRTEAAREMLRKGLDLAHVLGAQALRARAHEGLLATGARPRQLTSVGLQALTSSERQVARQAADGLTNREIAQALFVTLRTVEVHLTAVYRKLGVSGRGALGAFFDRPG